MWPRLFLLLKNYFHNSINRNNIQNRKYNLAISNGRKKRASENNCERKNYFALHRSKHWKNSLKTGKEPARIWTIQTQVEKRKKMRVPPPSTTEYPPPSSFWGLPIFRVHPWEPAVGIFHFKDFNFLVKALTNLSGTPDGSGTPARKKPTRRQLKVFFVFWNFLYFFLRMARTKKGLLGYHRGCWVYFSFQDYCSTDLDSYYLG